MSADVMTDLPLVNNPDQKHKKRPFKLVIWAMLLVVGLFIFKSNKEKPLVSLNREWRAVAEWGGYGTKQGQLHQPRQGGVDKEGFVYVMDRENHRVQKFTSEGKGVQIWGSLGTGKNQFKQSFGLAVDAERHFVYVVDTWNNAIKQFDASGKLKSVIQPKDHHFYGPRSIVMGKDGLFYISDTGNQRVLGFNAEGKVVRQWGKGGRGKGEFREPVGIGVDRKGNVYVADMENRRVQKFNSNGQYLLQWPFKNIKGFPREPYIAMDAEDRVFVSHSEASCFQVFGPDGKFLGVWGKNLKERPFDSPIGLSFGPLGEAYVADGQAHKIYKFQKINQ